MNLRRYRGYIRRFDLVVNKYIKAREKNVLIQRIASPPQGEAFFYKNICSVKSLIYKETLLVS